MIFWILSLLISFWTFAGFIYFMDNYLDKFITAKKKWKVFLISILFGPISFAFLTVCWLLYAASSVEKTVQQSNTKKKLDNWIDS